MQDKLFYKSATELAKLIREQKVSSYEVVRAHLEQIEKLNHDINAVVTLNTEALNEALKADEAIKNNKPIGPLHGVPMTIKDAFSTKGIKTTFGLPQYKNHIPKHDATLVTRLKNAGAIIIGKTNLPFMAFDWQCKHPNFGETKNPWNPLHTPGGSSGGTAAALAMGFTPIEVGSDIGGSIRYPAHCCGVLGLRPTEGLVPLNKMGPAGYPNAFRNLVSVGPMARTPEDLELVLNTLSADLLNKHVPQTAADFSSVKIAWTDDLGSIPMSAECKQIFHQFIHHISEHNSHMNKAIPDICLSTCKRIWGLIASYEQVALFPFILRFRFVRWFLQFGLMRAIFGKGEAVQFFSKGLGAGVVDYAKALTDRDQQILVMDEFLTQYDLWITPVSPIEAIPIQKVGTAVMIDQTPHHYTEALGDWLIPMTTLAHPIAVIPIGKTANGLPVGVQIHSRRFTDLVLLKLLKEITKIHPFDSIASVSK